MIVSEQLSWGTGIATGAHQSLVCRLGLLNRDELQCQHQPLGDGVQTEVQLVCGHRQPYKGTHVQNKCDGISEEMWETIAGWVGMYMSASIGAGRWSSDGGSAHLRAPTPTQTHTRTEQV